ncbi:MAG: heavy-metal-associated domain-containing protein [Verrucomicrobia bacterium]|nr:heavy-metal-associated domain-containing protein [Verrucomicrobiota bacterium]MCG2678556.1 heavy-metal-associated domain-containing protein [Kiritimatiellia bacterium]MBU4247471.1 heavy-metal-associated domain-containing protein [Verrucomicrobiota bacterium]MBU4292302.1 heavy-metal-associated domain-containing protein [Verrucomicrobiota bacterium]MBU4430402.1 heavy-metal-associated domain-containing protein [Verrucomicrobiota bacterium]
MKTLAGILAVLILLGLSACRKQDIRTVVIKVPGMKNPACTKLIQDAFLRQPGIQSIRPDFQNRELTITYNSMVVALKNLEFTIAGVGFDANNIKAFTNAVAGLPPECR